MYLRWLPATNQYTPLSLVSRARGRTCVGFCSLISNRTLGAKKGLMQLGGIMLGALMLFLNPYIHLYLSINSLLSIINNTTKYSYLKPCKYIDYI